MRLLSKMGTLLLAGTSAGCGDGGSGPDQSQVLTTVEVSPATAALYTVAPGNTVALTVRAKDQRGAIMTGIGAPVFSSENSGVVAVAEDGTITAIAGGTAQVTASLTAGGVTGTGLTTITVKTAPVSATVRAPQFEFEPKVVDVSAGGSVLWAIGDVHHNVAFTTAGAPADVAELRNATASRTFPNQGSFQYRCSLHPGMVASVVVH